MSIKSIWGDNRDNVLVIISAIILLADVIAQWMGFAPAAKLLPLILAVFVGLGLYYWEESSRKKVLILVVAILASFLIGLIDLKIYFPFGHSSFGSVLGFKVLGVPFGLGLLWLLATISAWQIVNFGRLTRFNKYFLAGGLAIMFSLVLEQFASSFSLWSWRSGQMPALNFAGWLALSGVTFYLYDRYLKPLKPSLYLASLLPMLSIYFWLMMLVR